MPYSSRFRVFENYDSASAQVAAEMAQLIRERATLGRTAVLGLATGKTPLPLYHELIYLHREEGLSFDNVVTFNLDEYHGLPDDHPASFRAVMQKTLFDHLDIRPENTHFLSGSIGKAGVASHCAGYERKIAAAGGIDFQILGIGRNGHIGFNEPGSAINSRTRMVELHDSTRRDAARTFRGIDNVPSHALTMGCGTILEARRIAMLAWGSRKSRIVCKAIKDPITPDLPASYLQNHSTTLYYLNPSAGTQVRRKGV
jgi:glucosamine-6-phosphate deaminase